MPDRLKNMRTINLYSANAKINNHGASYLVYSTHAHNLCSRVGFGVCTVGGTFQL